MSISEHEEQVALIVEKVTKQIDEKRRTDLDEWQKALIYILLLYTVALFVNKVL